MDCPSTRYSQSWLLIFQVSRVAFSECQTSIHSSMYRFFPFFFYYIAKLLFYIKYQCIKLYLLIFLLLIFLLPEFKPKTQGCINLIYIMGTQNICLHLMKIKLILTSELIYKIMKNLIFTYENFHHANNY